MLSGLGKLIGDVSRHTGRSVGLDVLRILMAFMVIGLHGGFLADIQRTTSYLLVEGVFRCAVPVFFIISGFYLQRLDGRTFVLWLRHVVGLYLLWMLIYAYLWWPMTSHSGGGLGERLLTGYHHLWYLSALPLAGILLFGLRHLRSGILLTGALGLAGIGLGLQYSANYHVFQGLVDQEINSVHIYRNFLLFGFPFMVLGFLMSRDEPMTALGPFPCAMAAVGAVLLLLLESGFNLRNAGPREHFDLLFALYFAGPALFLVARKMDIRGQGKEMALLATGIYLTHSGVLSILGRYSTLSATPKVLLTAVLSTGLAAVLLRVNRRLPVL